MSLHIRWAIDSLLDRSFNLIANVFSTIVEHNLLSVQSVGNFDPIIKWTTNIMLSGAYLLEESVSLYSECYVEGVIVSVRELRQDEHNDW